jgi:hypothetical protein
MKTRREKSELELAIESEIAISGPILLWSGVGKIPGKNFAV